jgi:tetratricopeptide (TPR) repeat protein
MVQIEGLVPVSKQEALILLEAGYLLVAMGRYNQARAVFQGVACLLPSSEVPVIALGTLEFAEGRYEKAIQEYRKARHLSPQSGLPRAHIGEMLLFLGKTREALKELHAAIELEPDGDGARMAQALLSCQELGVFSPRNLKTSNDSSIRNY